MVTHELKKYIKDASESGLSEEDIIISLIDVGWKVEDVDAAIKEVLNPRVERRHAMFREVPLLPSIAIFIVTGLFIFGGIFHVNNLFVADIDNYFSGGVTASVHEAYSAVLEQNIQHKRDNEKNTMLFVGDIMLSSNRGVGEQINEKGDYTYPFLKIASVLRSADLTFGNLEGPISSRGKDRGGKYSFRANTEAIQGLVFAGFDVLSVANNHIFDWGEDAFEDTMNVLRRNDIDYVGGGTNYSNANKPLIKNIGGTKVAFLAYSLVDYDMGNFEAKKYSVGKSSFNKEKVVGTIKELKMSDTVDIVVVSFHWGEEYKTRSYPKQQKIAYAMIGAGADLIIGHHPHVVQEIEKYKNGWIAYSLGNFIFDQSFSEETMRGLVLEVEIMGKKISNVNAIDIKISDTFQPHIEQ